MAQMEGKREPFKTKDNNRIVSTREDKKKKCFFPCSKLSDKVVTAVVISLPEKADPEVTEHQNPLSLDPSSFVLNDSWREDLCQIMQNLDMHTEKDYAMDFLSIMLKQQYKNVFRAVDIPKAVTTEMRTLLVDWLVQVHEYLCLQDETLYLAVFLMNSYMKVHKIRTPLLQLLATSCLYIACKMEERLIPEPAELCFMMEDAFSKKELLKMEKKVLYRLRFELQYTQPLHFLRLLSVSEKCPENVEYLAMYFMELTLMEADGAMIEPALLACGALSLAQMVSEESGTLSLEQTGKGPLYSYSDEDLIHPRQLMGKAALRASSDCKSTWQKFSRPQRHGVSTGPAMADSKHLRRCMG
ncbi:cyclin-P [Anomaloglossus baeobatrachus]|uniref:cyclin-P n=1 Tax=Anomaloglossus baeobatrachus TaxID=238106 RepID=UPI003F50503C